MSPAARYWRPAVYQPRIEGRLREVGVERGVYFIALALVPQRHPVAAAKAKGNRIDDAVSGRIHGRVKLDREIGRPAMLRATGIIVVGGDPRRDRPNELRVHHRRRGVGHGPVDTRRRVGIVGGVRV